MSSGQVAERSDADFLADVVKAAWTRDMIARGALNPDDIPPSGEAPVLAVDADCPRCGWPERTYDTGTRRFGCIKCEYTSDERNA